MPSVLPTPEPNYTQCMCKRCLPGTQRQEAELLLKIVRQVLKGTVNTSTSTHKGLTMDWKGFL